MNTQIKEIDSRIANETSIQNAAVRMLGILTDRMAREKCQADVLESQKRLEFLKNQRDLLIQRSSQSSLSLSQGVATSSPTAAVPSASSNSKSSSADDDKGRTANATEE